MTIQTPRITINDTTIDGILDKPAKANWVSSTPFPAGSVLSCFCLFDDQIRVSLFITRMRFISF